MTNLDASKSFTQQAKKNFDMSRAQGDVRWIIDDCKTFLEREIKREVKYDGIILDPPAFGRSGSRIWKIDEDLQPVFGMLPKLLSEDPLFVLISCHDQNWPALKLKEYVAGAMRTLPKHIRGKTEFGNMYLTSKPVPDTTPPKRANLEMGQFARWLRKTSSMEFPNIE